MVVCIIIIVLTLFNYSFYLHNIKYYLLLLFYTNYNYQMETVLFGLGVWVAY